MSPHVSVLEGELPEVGVDYAYMGPEGSQVTILVAATHVPDLKEITQRLDSQRLVCEESKHRLEC